MNIIFIDESLDDVELAVRELGRAGIVPHYRRVTSSAEFIEALMSAEWDIVLCERTVPLFEADEAWRTLRAIDEAIPFVVFTDLIYGEDLNRLLDAGIHFFVDKNRMNTVPPLVHRLTTRAGNAAQN